MKVTPAGHIEAMRGAHGNLVYTTRKDGMVIARLNSRPSRIASREQETVRNFNRESARVWAGLTPRQKELWRVHAAEFVPRDKRRKFTPPFGLMTFNRASFYRQLMGEAPVADVLPGRPPAAPTGVAPEISPTPDGLAFVVEHFMNPEGLLLSVRISPPSLEPRDNVPGSQLRFIRGMSSDSLVPMPPHGGTVSFPEVQKPLIPGMYYCLELRSVRIADGVSSLPVRLNVRKPNL